MADTKSHHVAKKTAEAAATNVLLGGPEDPVADVASAGVAASAVKTSGGSKQSSSSRSSRSSSSSSGTTGTSGSSGGVWQETASTGTKARKGASKVSMFATKPGRRVLLAEFLICMVIVGLGVLGVEPTMASSHVIRRVSALCALFFILAIVATWGDGPQRAANALGGLVVLSFLLTERKGFAQLANFFTAAQAAGDKSSTGSLSTEPAAGEGGGGPVAGEGGGGPA